MKIKHPDLEVTIDNVQIFLEVISPEMFKRLRYFKSATIPNRLRSKVTQELRRHFVGRKIDKDIVIVVDIGSSEINYSLISDYVEGPWQMVIAFDKKTGEVVNAFVKRGEAMAKVDEEVRQVIGIIGYKRIFSKADMQIHLKGRSFPNPDVPEKDKREILSKITQILLG